MFVHRQSVHVLVRAALLLGTFTGAALAQSFGPRQVAAPPEDILSGRLRLPEPGTVRTLSRVATIPIDFVPVDGAWAFEVDLPIDRPGGVSFVLAAPDTSSWSLRLTRPNGQAVALGQGLRSGAIQHRVGTLDGPLRGLVAERYDLAETAPGTWTVRVGAVGPRPAPGFLVAAGGSELHLASHLTTLELRSDRRIGVVAFALDGRRAAPLTGAEPSVGLIAGATLRVESPVGAWTLAMFDDGRHDDGAEADGVFGAYLPAGLSGDVVAAVTAEGFTAEGHPFLRTTRHAFSVVEPCCVLSGTATTTVISGHELALDVGVTLLGDRPRLQLSAEVWGTDAAGTLVPVCWLSRMLTPDPTGPDDTALRLVLDARWLNRSGASAPLELRRVRVQDPDTHVPYARRRRIALAPGPLPMLVGAEPTAIAPDMLKSRVGAAHGLEVAPGTYTLATGGLLSERVLMLTHGFCSSDVWGAGGFSEPRIDFLDLGQGHTHDEFAQLLLQFGADARSYGIVAHSQGGAAALQLRTYYASGLDDALGPRKIQSVGTPYQGTPLADWGGFTCGVIDDMTLSGAALWLAGIPSWARADVSYWTTSNAGFACSIWTDLLLSNPDDGVIEMARGQLPGGNSMGHTLGWCHSSDMADPPHTTDAARNAEMDAQAAR